MTPAELMKMEEPYSTAGLNTMMSSHPLLEWGTSEDGKLGFGSFLSYDGLHSALFRKTHEQNPDSSSLLEEHRYTGYHRDMFVEGGLMQSTFEWGARGVEIKTKRPPVLVCTFVNRAVVEKLLSRFKNTSHAAEPAVLQDIAARVAREDRLPAGVTQVSSDVMRAPRIQSIDDNSRHVWSVKGVTDGSRLVMLVSPDAGWIVHRPGASIATIKSKESRVSTELRSIVHGGDCEIWLEELALPATTCHSLCRLETLHGELTQAAVYVIKDIIWPVLIQSRKLVALVKKPLNYHKTRYLKGSYLIYAVSAFARGGLVGNCLMLKDRCLLGGSIEGAGLHSIQTAMDTVRPDQVWVTPDIPRQQFIENLKVAATMKAL